MGNWYQTKQASTFLLAIALMFASCNSYKKASFYPMINSVNQKKSGFQFKSIHKSAHQKNLKNDYAEVDISSASPLTSIKMGNDSNITRLKSIPSVNSVTNNRFSMTLNNQGTLSSSLSTEPIIARYNSIPDTSIIHNSLAIDSTQINITQIQPTSDSVAFDSNAKKLKQRDTFANISLIAAIVSIVSIFGIPFLFFPSVIAAIVFGALGLKSSKKKRARSGMLIGIILIVLVTIIVIAYVGAVS